MNAALYVLNCIVWCYIVDVFSCILVLSRCRERLTVFHYAGTESFELLLHYDFIPF